MKCNDCGFESQQGFSYCPQCGAGPQSVFISQNPAAQVVLALLKDTLFLVICILMSASCLLSLIVNNIPLITILTTVFLWLTYAQSKKNIADIKHLRCISGTVYAHYVITYVVAILLLLVGVLFAAAFGAIASTPGILDYFLSEFIEFEDSYAAFASVLASLSGELLLFIFAFVAIVIALINIFSIRYIHRFAKSVYQSIQAGVLAWKCVTATQVCLFIFGSCSGIGALSALAGNQMIDCLSSAANCGTCILAGLLIRKYFTAEQ